jgi:Pectate lyase superfamily protein
MQHPELINVKTYGAKGDGHTNDLNSLLLAFAAARKVSSPEIYFPSGEYNVSRTDPSQMV